MATPYLSVVIPVYNESDNLQLLYDRLTKALDALDKTFEIIFTNDGSRDNSLEMLNNFHTQRPTQIRVIDFNGNFGQHQAVMAGFEHSRGDVVVTLDADLQNPPEEIYKLLEDNKISKKINSFNELIANLIKDLENPRKLDGKISKSIDDIGQKTLNDTMRLIDNFLNAIN